jgi:uncharacterized lipoprotein
MMPRMINLRFCLLAVAAALSVLAIAACGEERTDVSQGVDKLNSQVLSQQGAELDCPDEVEGGEGATFDCTMKSTKGDKSADVKMKIVKEDGDLAVDIADAAQFEKALTTVAGGA